MRLTLSGFNRSLITCRTHQVLTACLLATMASCAALCGNSPTSRPLPGRCRRVRSTVDGGWCMSQQGRLYLLPQVHTHLIVYLQVAGAHQVLSSTGLRIVLNSSKDVLNAAAHKHDSTQVTCHCDPQAQLCAAVLQKVRQEDCCSHQAPCYHTWLECCAKLPAV
jgi:hypothetical protein